MTRQPPDYTWLDGTYGGYGYCFIYVRDAPENVVARLGGQWADFTPGPFPDNPDDFPVRGEHSGIAAIGEWTFILDAELLFFDEEAMSRLSAGTRVVVQSALSIKGLDDFRCFEDGELTFGFWAQEGFLEVPDELTSIVEEIDRSGDDIQGSFFQLVEHLTGLFVTEELVKGSSFRWGRLPASGAA
ncbi:MAG: hypothetical protein HOV86_23400 [Thermoactinospora sp.]|nr:hypothetical protein [Thermoactinospora sp.]